jgi:hypothetical protein
MNMSNINEFRFYTLNDMLMMSRLSTISRLMQNIPTQEELDAFQYFKENYYRDATFLQHQVYAKRLLSYKLTYQEYPSEREFYLSFRSSCMCNYSTQLDDNEFVNAADFFMKKTGDICSHQCEMFYYYKEFCTLEHRAPNDMEEFNHYIAAIFLAIQNPDAFFSTPAVTRPISDTKVDELKKSVINISNESCGICQDDIHDQNAVKLECGHYFHSDNKDCCENGTIFNWLQSNRLCPICRHELK